MCHLEPTPLSLNKINTWGITLLHSIFDVLTINGNFYWKRGRIDLKSKRLNYFLVNNSSLRNVKNSMKNCYSSSIRWESITFNDRFLSNTWGITLLHSIFDVLTINGNLYWKRGKIDLKSKRLNSFLVNNSS